MAVPVRALRVLLVDDVADLRFLLRVVLENDGGFEVVGEAGDGRRAVELAERTNPDVVVLDLSMPTMDGLEAIPRLRHIVPDAHIVVLSGFQGARLAAATSLLGADAYLEKGTPPAEVLRSLKSMLGIDDAPAVVSGTVTVPESDVVVVLAQTIRAQSTDHRLLAVADDVIAAHDIDRTALRADLEPASPAAVLMDLEAPLASLCGDHRLELGVEPDLPVVLVDRPRLAHLLANLARNAATHGPAGTPVGVRAHRDGVWVAIEVTDHGPGIPASDRGLVLGRHVRLARDPGGLGLGLGLYVASTYARAMGGSIAIGERDGGGARVVCRLRVAESSG